MGIGGNIRISGIWPSHCHICYEDASSFTSPDDGETWICNDCIPYPQILPAIKNRILAFFGKRRLYLKE